MQMYACVCKSVSNLIIICLSAQNETTRQEILSLAKAKNVKELEKRLCSRMEFGTAGDDDD